MKITRFEDLQCWQESRNLVTGMYSLVKKDKFSKDKRLVDQLTGAGISVMNNIAEGFDSGSNPNFSRYLTHARASCSELQNCLYIALDQNYINQAEFDNLYQHGTLVRKLIDGLKRYLKTRSTV